MYPSQYMEKNSQLIRWWVHQWGISNLDRPLLKQSISFYQIKMKLKKTPWIEKNHIKPINQLASLFLLTTYMKFALKL